MTELFTPAELAPVKRRRSKTKSRARICIPTGQPRIVEASGVDDAVTWALFIDEIRRSAASRIDLLSSYKGTAKLTCPWARLTSCDSYCRCRGWRTVTVDFLRDHYTHLAAEIVAFARSRGAR